MGVDTHTSFVEVVHNWNSEVSILEMCFNVKDLATSRQMLDMRITKYVVLLWMGEGGRGKR